MEIPAETRETIRQRITEIRQRYPDARAACLPALHVTQKHLGCVSQEALDLVAQILALSRAHVQGVATFYTMYRGARGGRYLVQACSNVSCMLRGAQSLLSGLEEHLGINAGETSGDGLFTLEEVECLAACGSAPVLVVNDQYYEHMDLDRAKALIARLRAEAGSPGGEGASPEAPKA